MLFILQSTQLLIEVNHRFTYKTCSGLEGHRQVQELLQSPFSFHLLSLPTLKTDLKEMSWIILAKGRVKWQAFVNRVMSLGFNVLTAVTVKTRLTVFWDVMLCSLIEVR
jgi:hypothetical protein